MLDLKLFGLDVYFLIHSYLQIWTWIENQYWWVLDKYNDPNELLCMWCLLISVPFSSILFWWLRISKWTFCPKPPCQTESVFEVLINFTKCNYDERSCCPDVSLCLAGSFCQPGISPSDAVYFSPSPQCSAMPPFFHPVQYQPSPLWLRGTWQKVRNFLMTATWNGISQEKRNASRCWWLENIFAIGFAF